MAPPQRVWVPKTPFRLQFSLFGLSGRVWHLTQPASVESRSVALFEHEVLAPMAVGWLVVSPASTVSESAYRVLACAFRCTFVTQSREV